LALKLKMAKTKANKKYLDDGQKENMVGRFRLWFVYTMFVYNIR